MTQKYVKRPMSRKKASKAKEAYIRAWLKKNKALQNELMNKVFHEAKAGKVEKIPIIPR